MFVCAVRGEAGNYSTALRRTYHSGDVNEVDCTTALQGRVNGKKRLALLWSNRMADEPSLTRVNLTKATS
jgi:hypothetical protein